MQASHSLLSAASLLLLLGLGACGDSSKEADANGSGATEASASGSGEAGQPTKPGLGDYVSPGASADTLMKASREGNAEMVKLLIGEGAKVDVALPDGLCALHVAVAEGHVDVVRVLLENKANPNPRQAGGATPLIAAMQAKNVELIQMLLDNGADPTIPLYAGGKFALCLFDDLQWEPEKQIAVADLLLKGGARVNQRLGPKSNTALMIYTAYGNVPMVKWLLSHNAKIDLKGEQGYTALAFAAISNKVETARLLVEAGADLSIVNMNGDTAQKVAERTQQAGVAGYLKQQAAKQAQGR